MKYVMMLGMGLMVAALSLTGCSDTKLEPHKGAVKKRSKAVSHTHGEGPHGGVIFDLGKYHAEFTVDHPKKECTILLLKGDDKDAKPLPVAAKEFTLTTKETKTKEGTVVPPMTIQLLPTDAKEGKASKFVGSDPGIGHVADFAGTVVGEIDDKPSSGEFQE